MSSRAITRVARIWNRRADLHNDFYSHYPSEHREQWRGVYRQALRSLLGADHGALRVLDVGAGTGFGAVLMAELGHQVTGIDLSAKMLEHARRVAEQRGVEVDFRLHGAHDAQALERQFDLVTSRYVLWTLPEPERALSSWRTVLRPGGAVLISDGLWYTLRHSWQQTRASLRPGASHRYLARVLSNYLSMRHQLPFWRGLTVEQARSLLLSAGFTGPERFDQLLPTESHPVCAQFFMLGAHNPAERPR